MADLKPFLPIADQIERLESRGMAITDSGIADRWLKSIGYYRLSGYWYPFVDTDVDPESGNRFVPGTTFDEIVRLYEFDRHLKTHMLSAIERVEVAMRSQVGHTLGARGPMSYLDGDNFDPEFVGSGNHMDWLATAFGRVRRQRTKDQSLKHHFENYDGRIPIWVLTDVLDFSDLSKLYAGLREEDRDTIALWFDIPAPVPEAAVPRRGRGSSAARRNRRRRAAGPGSTLANLLEQLTIVRNISAHHSRLWNRRLVPIGTSSLRSVAAFDGLPAQSERVYGVVVAAAHLLQTTSPGSAWIKQLEGLIDRSFPPSSIRTPQEMGFPPEWKQLPLWHAMEQPTLPPVEET
ncbi:Abi family protein [Rhodococcoides fascians]|uniref:Abi family protein n=1 Tax=Rhodococcoides fascians TaxID=1828 RepID=UPI0006907ED6|nr:Abi family protein [Rhodococcus fascians]